MKILSLVLFGFAFLKLVSSRTCQQALETSKKNHLEVICEPIFNKCLNETGCYKELTNPYSEPNQIIQVCVDLQAEFPDEQITSYLRRSQEGTYHDAIQCSYNATKEVTFLSFFQLK
jgi:hypothetical protein